MDFAGNGLHIFEREKSCGNPCVRMSFGYQRPALGIVFSLRRIGSWTVSPGNQEEQNRAWKNERFFSIAERNNRPRRHTRLRKRARLTSIDEKADNRTL